MTTAIEPTEMQMPVPQAPAKPKIQNIEVSDNYGKFVIEPLERGFGATLGNALRRVLLNSLKGGAINAVQIDGIQHEYSPIPGVKEDVTELILNVKGICLRAHSDKPGALRLTVQGPGQVTAGDIQPSADFEVVNPEHYLASLDSGKAKLSIEFKVAIGKGYVPAAPIEGAAIGVLPVDTIYTPIRKVNYLVEKTRVGQVTDFERLTLEIWTNGAKHPVEAVREAAQILVDSFFQFSILGKEQEEGSARPALTQAIPTEVYNMPIEKLDLSARTLNCLKRSKINKVGEVLEKNAEELLRIKNFGDKSLSELYGRLRSLGYMKDEEPEEEEPITAEAPVAAEAEAPTPIGDVAAKAPDAAKREKDKTPKAKETIRDLGALRTFFGGEPKDGDNK